MTSGSVSGLAIGRPTPKARASLTLACLALHFFKPEVFGEANGGGSSSSIEEGVANAEGKATQ